MQDTFLDRILTCVDCHGEFIFTAGEQLFFFDKQFKNDPKRCKPCKNRRSGLAAAANGSGPAAAGLSRTETRTLCSDCGIETTVPFKPTQGRPVLCRQCFQIKNRAVIPAALPNPVPTQVPGMAAEALSLTSASAEMGGSVLSRDAALAAASSMAGASAQSSVASSADLAYVVSLSGSAPSLAQVTTGMFAKSPAELIASSGSTPELQPAHVESAQA